MTRVFGHGGLRLFLLLLLADEPRHGYDLMMLIEDRFFGLYTPSAGTIYPRLAALEEEGLVEHEETDGRKVFRLTEKGRAEVEARREELQALQARATEMGRRLRLAQEVTSRSAGRQLRDELRDVMREVRRDDRRQSRQHRSGDARRTGPGRSSNEPLGVRALREDLAAFADDILAAGSGATLDRETLRSVRDELLAAQETILALLPPAAADRDGGGDAG